MKNIFIDGKQHICFSIDELFDWQDKLDTIEKQDRHLAWQLFDDFLWEAEGTLQYSDQFIKEMEEIRKKVENGDYSDFVKWDEYEDR